MNCINNNMNTKYVLQTTLRNKISFSGVGIHNGKAVTMSIEGAAPNTGIVFERIDLDKNNLIKANINNVDTSQLCTKITNQFGVSVSTIEHLMAAFSGLNIDNIKVKLNSPELPAMDGSSEEYTRRIINSGIETQNVNRKYLKVTRKITIRDNNRYISIMPADELTLDVEISYPNTIIGNDKFFYRHSSEAFINDICKARTFAFHDDIKKMRTSGLAIGGSLKNAIVVDKLIILNSSGLRLEKEFTKHKVLDCLGDFYLLGMPIIGKIQCFAPGHKLNQNFIKEIFKDKENYKIENKTFTSNNFYNLLTNSNINNEIVKFA